MMLSVFNQQVVSSASNYRYAYLRGSYDQPSNVLLLLDPAGIEQIESRELPRVSDEGYALDRSLYGAIPDPSGEWLLLPYRRYTFNDQLYLYHLASNSFEQIAEGGFPLTQGHPDQHIVWSPNGKFFAFSMRPDEAIGTDTLAVYLYDMTNKSLTRLFANVTAFSRIAWAQDSSVFVVSTQRCEAGRFDMAHCKYGLATYDAESGTRRAVISLQPPAVVAAGFDALCALSWSPDNRFVSFVSMCSLEPMNPPIEVFVWDTMQNEVYAVTDFTGAVKQPPDRLYLAAYYETVWAAPDILLIGAEWDSGSNLNSSTVVVQLPDKKTITLMTAAVEQWAVNPISGLFAYRSVDSLHFDLQGSTTVMPRLTIASFESATEQLASKWSRALNACRLAWSPNGTILVYTIVNTPNRYAWDCGYGVGGGFINDQLEAIATYQLEDTFDQYGNKNWLVAVGWLKIE